MVAEKLERLAKSPTTEQLRVGKALGISLPTSVPAPVVGVILQQKLASALFKGIGNQAVLPDSLGVLEDELGVTDRAFLITHSREEVSAWFNARYMEMTARGLRHLKPAEGDVVQLSKADQRRVISSIGEDGRVYFKGRPSNRAWPNHLVMVARVGDPEHAALVAAVDAALRNSANYTSVGFESLAVLEPYALQSRVPAPEALRAFEDLIESGETLEPPFQKLIETYPALLASTVIGSWKTYVIPQKRLGAEYVPDFLVLGINSLGPHWVAVEIEAARHSILNKNQTLSPATRHAVEQIKDWREWLTDNVAYAQMTLGLPGLTNRVPGLVVIGRDAPSASRRPSRAQSVEDSAITIHSWDWLLRSAQQMARHPLQPSELASQVGLKLDSSFPD